MRGTFGHRCFCLILNIFKSLKKIGKKISKIRNFIKKKKEGILQKNTISISAAKSGFLTSEEIDLCFGDSGAFGFMSRGFTTNIQGMQAAATTF